MAKGGTKPETSAPSWLPQAQAASVHASRVPGTLCREWTCAGGPGSLKRDGESWGLTASLNSRKTGLRGASRVLTGLDFRRRSQRPLWRVWVSDSMTKSDPPVGRQGTRASGSVLSL